MTIANLCLVLMALLVAVPGYARDQGVPDEEMLEFLADFETAGGKPIDPLMLADQEAEQPQPPARAAAAETKRAGQVERNKRKERKEQANDE